MRSTNVAKDTRNDGPKAISQISRHIWNRTRRT